MSATMHPDPPRRNDAAGTEHEESTPKSPGPPPNHPEHEDDGTADSPDDAPKSPGPPPGSVPDNQ